MRPTDAACPGALHGVGARDGVLVRIRTPGGLVTSEQLLAIADASERWGDSNVDITARANVQLRGLRPEALDDLAPMLESCGLLPSRAHDRVRNIAASPFAGADSRELVDASALVKDLDERLIAATDLAELPPKFVFAIDGGARAFDAGEADLSVRAVRGKEGDIAFHLVIGGRATGLGARVGDVVEVLIEAARSALHFAMRSDVRNSWRVATLAGARQAIARSFKGVVFPCVFPAGASRTQPLGVLEASDSAHVHIVPCVALGRLSADQVRVLASLALRSGARLRLAWWRGVALLSVPKRAVGEIVKELESIGLPTDRSSGHVGIAACSGTHGCSRAFADVRSHANKLAELVAATSVEDSWSVNIAGCSKRCAMRKGAAVELVASESGYDVTVWGVCAGHDVAASAAIEAALSAGAPSR